MGVQTDNRKTVVIIGAGASGTLLAARGVSEWSNANIYLIDREANFARGLAYSPGSPDFVLNVPAAKMGAFAENPAHFYKWLWDREDRWKSLDASYQGRIFTENDFVPRMIYGAYLEDILSEAQHKAQESGNYLEQHIDTVRSVSKNEDDGRLNVQLEGGSKIIADIVIFATGNSSSRSYHSPTSNIYPSPYVTHFLKREWKDTDHIIMLGAGLSMVDAAYHLSLRGYKGKITSLSRSGLKPFSHITGAYSVDAPFNAEHNPESASALLLSLRKAIAAAGKRGIPWQAIIDSLRPFSNDLWVSLPENIQRKLWRALSFWNPTRHRIPAFVEARLAQMSAAGHLDICKGNIRSVAESDDKVIVTLKDGTKISGTAAIHCLGFDYSMRNLSRLCPDIELNTHWSGNAGSSPEEPYKLSSTLPVYGIGPMFFGSYIESTAVPDIRQQAMNLSKIIAQSLS